MAPPFIVSKMGRPFIVTKGGILGQTPTPTPITVYDIEAELAARGYRMQPREPVDHVPPMPVPEPPTLEAHEPPVLEPPIPEPPVHEPHEPPIVKPPLHLPLLEPPKPEPAAHEPLYEPIPEPPVHIPDVEVPYEAASPYAKYIRFIPYLFVLFRDKSVLDFRNIV